VPTHYEVLGVARSASDDEVRHAYRTLVKGAHPDAAGDAARFRRITEAYDVLTDPARRAAYDRSLPRPAYEPAPARRRPRRAPRIGLLLVAAVVVAGVLGVIAGTTELSLGDTCLVGTWEGGAFEIPVRATLDGREVATSLAGGAGVLLAVAADGKVRTDYAGAAPLTGSTPAHRVEGAYAGATTERWQASGGRVRLRGTDTSGLRFQLLISGRAPDQPVAVTILDREYAYACTATTLELGPYRYTHPG
jgi:hypothetical protein